MAAPSELERLLRESPLLVESARGHTCVGGTHSRTHDGRIVCWSPNAQAPVAVDAESVHGRVPAIIRRRLGSEVGDDGDFWATWVTTEVAAKLADLPIITWLTTRPSVLASPVEVDGRRIDWVLTDVPDHPDLVVAVGIATDVEGGSPTVATAASSREQESPE